MKNIKSDIKDMVDQLAKETERELKKAVNAVAVQGISFLVMTSDFNLKFVPLDQIDGLIEKARHGRLKSN